MITLLACYKKGRLLKYLFNINSQFAPYYNIVQWLCTIRILNTNTHRYMYIYVRMHMRACVDIYLYNYAYEYICICTLMYTYTHAHTHICMCVCFCLYLNVWTYLCLQVYILPVVSGLLNIITISTPIRWC